MRTCLIALVVCVACSKDKSPPAGATEGSKTGATKAANAVTKLTEANVCSLLPMEQVKRLIPDGDPPKASNYPLECAVYAKAASLEISFNIEPPINAKDGEPVPNLGEAAIFQRLAPKYPGNVYMTVMLGTDDHGNNHNLHAEINTSDGKDHVNDTAEMCRYVIAHLPQ